MENVAGVVHVLVHPLWMDVMEKGGGGGSCTRATIVDGWNGKDSGVGWR